MPDKQHASRFKHSVDALEHTALRGRIKVNHDIAAKHHVKGLAERPIVPNQVDADELDELYQLRLDANQARIATLAAQEKALEMRWRQPLESLQPIDTLGRSGQNTGIDITGHQLEGRIGPQGF